MSDAEIGMQLIADLHTFNVTGEVGIGFSIVREFVSSSSKVRKVFVASGGINCYDDIDLAISEVAEDVYQYLSRKTWSSPDSIVRCVRKIVGFKAIDYVRRRDAKIVSINEAVRKIGNSLPRWVDSSSAIDMVIDLKDSIHNLGYCNDLNSSIWECLVERHSYAVRELSSYLGVSYRHAIGIRNKLLSLFTMEEVYDL